MTIADMFSTFLDNLKIDNADTISHRYREITKALNKKFRDTESETANCLQVGSYGRWTGIKGVSDLDMLYIMPANEWDNYKSGGQSRLLDETKEAIQNRYPRTDVRKDRLVVTVKYQKFHVEVQPVFEFTDENGDSFFKYPETYYGGSWKITKPCQEIKAMKEFVDNKNKNLRRLCKMARAWKNKHGVVMGGLLIDTLAYNFLKSTNYYDDKSFFYYDWMSRDFFKYLKDQPNQDHYKALGSGQNVNVKKRFQKKAKEAYELSLKAIEAGDSSNGKWKKIYGIPFPAAEMLTQESAYYWRDTEEFIDEKFEINIQYDVRIDCEVTQNGFREMKLREWLSKTFRLQTGKSLRFHIVDIDVDLSSPYKIYWKVLNCGEVAQRKNQIRGQIQIGSATKTEQSSFNGEHIVDCYIVKDDVVVARDSIDVPITGDL